MKRYAHFLVPVFGLIAALALAGCGDGNNDSGTTRNATVPPFTPANDVQFIDAMMTHHDMAVQMTTLEIQKGTRADVKAMAQTMKDAQSAEMATMRTARQALAGSPDVPTPPADKHMDDDMMLLQQASGAQVDAVFLEHMIAHHAEAISIAHRAMPNLQRADLKTMATDITTSQAKEVGDMQDMR